MHDAPFPRLIALLLTGACRAGKNTYYPDRRRPARVLISEVVAGLSELARGRHLALGDRGEIVMAHPFSTVPLGFSLMGARTL